MTYPRHELTLVLLVLVLANGSLLRAEKAEDRERTNRIECLIEVLASQNRAPEVRGDASRGEDQTIDLPKEYDRSLQVPVYLAVKELLAEDEAAMDLMLAHKDDDRYSFSVNSDMDYNVSVSRACERIARQKLLCYERELLVITRSQFGLYPADLKESFRIWWGKNKQRGIATLQVEAIDAAIKFMTDVDGATALPWHPEAAQLPIDEFNRRRDANLQRRKAIREYVVASGRPYRPRTLDDAHSCFFGLPWTGRRHNK